jgi:hypothetical protein
MSGGEDAVVDPLSFDDPLPFDDPLSFDDPQAAAASAQTTIATASAMREGSSVARSTILRSPHQSAGMV